MLHYKINLDTIPWQSPMPGVRFRAYEQDGKRMRFVEYTRDFVEPDWCLKGHIGYVIEGRFEIDFNGNIITFGPGDGIFITQGEEHKHKARPLTDIVRVILLEDL